MKSDLEEDLKRSFIINEKDNGVINIKCNSCNKEEEDNEENLYKEYVNNGLQLFCKTCNNGMDRERYEAFISIKNSAIEDNKKKEETLRLDIVNVDELDFNFRLDNIPLNENCKVKFFSNNILLVGKRRLSGIPISNISTSEKGSFVKLFLYDKVEYEKRYVKGESYIGNTFDFYLDKVNYLETNQGSKLEKNDFANMKEVKIEFTDEEYDGEKEPVNICLQLNKSLKDKKDIKVSEVNNMEEESKEKEEVEDTIVDEKQDDFDVEDQKDIEVSKEDIVDEKQDDIFDIEDEEDIESFAKLSEEDDKKFKEVVGEDDNRAKEIYEEFSEEEESKDTVKGKSAEEMIKEIEISDEERKKRVDKEMEKEYIPHHPDDVSDEPTVDEYFSIKELLNKQNKEMEVIKKSLNDKEKKFKNKIIYASVSSIISTIGFVYLYNKFIKK